MADNGILFSNKKELKYKCKRQCDKSNQRLPTQRNQGEKAVCSDLPLNGYAKDKTWGTKTICRVAREGKEGDWLQRSTKCLYVVPDVFWGQLCSPAYCQYSNILSCDCTGHTSVCVCQNRGRLVILWVLYKSNAFPGRWLKHCAPLPELQVEGWEGPRRPSFYLSYWQLLAPGILESFWSLWSNPQRGEERNGAC